eukprot:CAMPEP_0181471466 /NCGR_PEP_ID=MMETSP1110-20121109/39087_1 /TAXON_ID=174948 /ORGANISM="Symbiodinium sp., Strain CCMP421" /LENGTH=45 /DNA_ID= /DNA_START= /DNA_END= /DNA_ORIENTATION=
MEAAGSTLSKQGVAFVGQPKSSSSTGASGRSAEGGSGGIKGPREF